ncbi:MAG: Gfo/Idh/MocA family oxidoreductase [Pseudomonadota bacterium]|nr:Gfo/Idh/MocA family oxidoreductase [Pseudomonadota bacterium]
MQRRLRLGMVGGGQGAFIGAVHRIAARLDDHYELVAGALSGDPARAVASAADVRMAPERSYTSYQEMARAESGRDDGIDVVAIVTPNHLHAPVATAFLEAGIHVICDKPLGMSLAEGRALATLARHHNKLFALTHTYTGYPMVRQARAMVEAGEIGELRLVQVEYSQDWLAASIATGAVDNWKNDPLRAGPGGTLSDVGTHAYHLAQFVSGQKPSSLLAELTTFVPGRPLGDHVQAMLRYPNGARGTLWASQVATGCENTVRLRLFGSKAQLDFNQETPAELWFTPQGGNPQRLTPGRVGSAAAAHATRVPAGHPEGYLEAFAQLYSDAARHIIALDAGLAVPLAALWLPTVDDGVDGMAFIEAVLASHQNGGVWTDVPATC